MATYKEKVGTSVVNYAGDYPGAVDGELWYDSTNKDFKYQYLNVTSAGSWRTGGNLNTARRGAAGAGTSTAGLAFGGEGDPPVYAQTEKYDGVSWTEVNDLNTARTLLAGAGTQTSALAFGGQPSTAITESWNGTSWTELNDMGTARRFPSGTGSSVGALAAGGRVGTTGQSLTEEWTAPLANKTITAS